MSAMASGAVPGARGGPPVVASPPVDLDGSASLDFVEFALTLRDTLERGGNIDFEPWLKASGKVPLDCRYFLWLIADMALSDLARSNLRRQHHGSTISTNLVRAGRARPPAKVLVFQSPRQEFDAYAAVFRKFGSRAARSDLAAGKVVLLALRSQSSTLAHHGKGSYDDRLIVLRRTGPSGQVSAFPICTEPGAQYSQRAKAGAAHDARYDGVKFRKPDGYDSDGDGILDAGRLLAGTYHYYEKTGGHLGDRAFQVKAAQVAQRDTNGDGWFNGNDQSRLDRVGAATTMYIHRGGEDVGKGKNFEANTWSAGCQTIPKNRYASFLGHIRKPADFYYVLVNG